MRHFIIDGNNLIGKMPALKSKNKITERENLAFILERYFSKKKAKVSLHYDGHQTLPIKVTGIKIFYSGSRTADEMIKQEIERSNNRKNIVLITSDTNLKEFARVCSCKVMNSEEFNNEINSMNDKNEESKIIESLSRQTDEFKKLFNAD